MINRVHRFHGYGSLRYAYKQGRVSRGPLFAVKSIYNERRKDYRIAVVVSRKVNKSAVARNRIRRRIYGAVRDFGAEINQPFDIVITVFNDSVLETAAEDLRSQIKKQFRENGILKS